MGPAAGTQRALLDDAPGSLERLLEWAERDEANGMPDAPWPPTFPKMPGEARRVAPSRRGGARAEQDGNSDHGRSSKG
ncbi:hypothetical protein [uncultured Candidatus Microthrix sp.]|jgi:bifunctional non-homologous end joining protein LigD|uniref:hypothetical protein n=1 Tax=Candidatus Neomicrothrix sp. TaxID=2719034 RepID=UPI0025914E3B|nr:hypothetical protein [Candidatus Microthrix sp.]HMS46464.1 hypothetical protein [Candidatus Microthrix sp.]